jgi:hypothetical protein
VDPASAGTDDDVVDVVDVGVLVGVVEVELVVGVDVGVDVEAGGATPVSGDTHPAGDDVAPDCPGMSTVPAQPKSENFASLELVEPSVKCATDRVWRIYPDASMETCTVVPVYPWDARMAFAAAIASASCAVVSGTFASCAAVMDS